jgi:hypothetical protein
VANTNITLPIREARHLCRQQLCDDGQISHCLFREDRSLCRTAYTYDFPLHPTLKRTPIPDPPGPTLTIPLLTAKIFPNGQAG